MANRKANMQGVKTHSTKKANTHTKQSKGAKLPGKSKTVKIQKPNKMKLSKLDRMIKAQYKTRLYGDITEEKYRSFARRINSRLKTIEKDYGTESNLYQQYIKQFNNLDSGLVIMRDNGTVSLKTGKKAYNTFMNSEKNKLGFSKAQQTLNLMNSYDSVAMRNERTSKALKELGKSVLQYKDGVYVDEFGQEYDKNAVMDYYRKESEKLEKIGEYISEHYEEVLYKDAENERSADDKEIIDILRQEKNTYSELDKVYKYIKKEEKKMQQSKAHQERAKTVARLNKKKVK